MEPGDDGAFGDRRVFDDAAADALAGEVAAIPKGHALLVRGASWGLLNATPYYETAPWSALVPPAERASLDTSVTSDYTVAALVGTGTRVQLSGP